MFLGLRILLIGLLYLSSTNVSALESFTKEWISNEAITEHNEQPMTIGKDNIFLYDNYPGKYDSNGINYTINYDLMNINGSVYDKKCIYLLEPTKGFKITWPIILSHLGEKVLISYIDFLKPKDDQDKSVRSYTIYRMINMSTCNYTEIDIYGESNENDTQNNVNFKPQIIQFEDGSYEMFLGPEFCDGARCRRKVNANGSLEDGIVSYVPKELQDYQIKFYPTKSTDEYFVVIEYYTDLSQNKSIEPLNLIVMYAWPGGRIEEFLNLYNEGLYQFDATENYMSICGTTKLTDMNNTYIHCFQYDSNRTRTLRQFFIVSPNITDLKMSNLKGGGLLLLIQERQSDEFIYDKCKENYAYQMWRVWTDANGQNSSPWRVEEDFDVAKDGLIDCSITMSIPYSDEKNVCQSILLKGNVKESEVGVSKMRFARKCIPASRVMMHLRVGK